MKPDTKVVTEHYLAEKRPEELRGDIDPVAQVRVSVENAAAPSDDLPQLISYLGAGRGVYSEEAAVSYIRMLRDE